MGVYVPPPRCALEECCLCTIAQFQCILNPLESALTRPLASVHYTGLAEKVRPLKSALTKNMGGGGPSWQRARHESPISGYPSRWAQSRRISASQGGRFGFFGCVRSEGIRPTRCKNTAAECLYAETGSRNATFPSYCSASDKA